ncbi:unnamed protein product [Ixodes pacificus]
MPKASPAQEHHEQGTNLSLLLTLDTLSTAGIELGLTPEAPPAPEPGAQDSQSTAEKEQGIMPEASTAQEHHEPGM